MAMERVIGISISYYLSCDADTFGSYFIESPLF